jgi:ferredoxin-NADP reductase
MGINESLVCGKNMLKECINRTTMYRLVLFYLLILFVVALFFSFSVSLLWSAVVLLVASWLSNTFFARMFKAVTNLESIFITALILALIMTPVMFRDVVGSITLVLVAVLASASKYIIAIGRKHIFNPAAFAVVLSAFLFNMPATWWIAGNPTLLPIIFIGGLIIVYKLRRFDLILAFGISALATVAFTSKNPIAGIEATLLYSVFFFFAFVMLTEPFTTPPTRALRIAYGAIIGVLFIQAPHIGSFYFSPELALITGNLFSYLVSPKGRYLLSLVERRTLANGIYEFIFRSDRKLLFKSGQYLEWTLGNVPSDNRGNRRFFTIASAPEDETLALATRIPDNPSAFKRSLAELPVGGVISVASLGGDFVMPTDTRNKLAFLAGGIGVTPFASMARHCIKTGENRDAVLLYSSKTEEEVAYKDIFSGASRLGWRTVYRIGAVDSEFIKQAVPDYLERLFYVSGPPSMVDAMKNMLIGLGISRFNIKTDFFSGLA